jgi:hypothetical protein
VQLASRFGCERAVGEFDLGCAGTLAQLEAGQCLLVVGVGRFPAKGIGQSGRWSDLDILPDQVEELASGGCIAIRYAPPTLTSRVTSGQVNPSGPHDSVT